MLSENYEQELIAVRELIEWERNDIHALWEKVKLVNQSRAHVYIMAINDKEAFIRHMEEYAERLSKKFRFWHFFGL